MIEFKYMNHRGLIENRRVEGPYQLEFVFKPGMEYQPGWALSAMDVTRASREPIRRSFMLSHVMLDATLPLRYVLLDTRAL